MVIQRSLQALIAIWHELPRLVGTDWSMVLPRLRALLRQVESANDPPDRDWLTTDILDMLRPYPHAATRLDDVRIMLGMTTGHRGEGRIQPTPTPSWKHLLGGIRNRLHPEQETRFTDVAAPARLPAGERGTVALRLTLDEPAHSHRVEQLLVKTDQVYEVQLVSLDEHLEILGDSTQRLLVERGLDSQAVVFFVLGRTSGDAILRLLLWHEGHQVADFPLTIEIAEAASERPLDVKPQQVLLADPEIPPADLDFRVLLRPRDGQTAFRFIFHSHTGAVGVHGFELPGPIILGTPDAYQAGLWQTLESLTSATRLASLGERLFEELLPPEAHDIWREAVQSSARSLQITSDEPWIPWELLRPSLDDGEESFLCERFHTARWLSGGKPASRILVSDLACLESETPPGGDTDAPCTDRPLLAEIAHRHQVLDLSPARATPDALHDLLDRGLGLWHFAAYRGSTDQESPDEQSPKSALGQAPAVPLEGGRFHALDLDRKRRKTIAGKRPLVVFNVGGAGSRHLSLTSFDGWAETWIRRAGCGAFLAPLWRTDGHLARAFVETMYSRLGSGKSLGEAVAAARQAVRERDPNGAAWLTFTLYGHPNSCIHFGTGDSPVVQSEDS